MPTPDALDRAGLDVSEATMKELLTVDAGEWRGEIASMREFFAKFGDEAPEGDDNPGRRLGEATGGVDQLQGAPHAAAPSSQPGGPLHD